MEFRFEVQCEVERTEGKFASRDELSELLIEEGFSEPSDVTTGDDAVYRVVSWEVEDVTPLKKPRKYTPEQALADLSALVVQAGDLGEEVSTAAVRKILRRAGIPFDGI